MVVRRPWWVYAVTGLAIAYLVGSGASAVFAAHRAGGWPSVVVMVALYGIAAVCCVAAVCRRGETPVLLGVAAAAGVVAQVFGQYAGVGLLFLVVWIAPFRLRLVRAVLLLVLVVAGFVASTLVTSMPAAAVAGIAAAMGWALFLAAVIRQLSVTRSQADAVAVARSNEAVFAERQRLAREIHDVLAHALSAQVVHLEGTRMLLEHGGDPAQVLERVIKAGDLARTGLEETKRAVEALRGDQEPLADQLEVLATEFRAATGRSCSVVVSGDPDQLAPQIRLAVLRTAQEALTNVRKHAPGAEVTVVLRDAAGWCELDVRDTGGGVVAASSACGYGLVGMRERAELIGGHLEAGPDGPGFRVRLRVPA